MLFPAILEVQLIFETQCDGNNCDGQFWAIDHFRVCTENGNLIFTKNKNCNIVN